MWEYEAYRLVSHGEKCTPTFLDIAKPAKGSTITDFGTGSGKGAVALKKAGLVVTTTDIADNCRDHDALHIHFNLHDMREPMPWRTEYGFCCDVMEHIPPEDVNAVLTNIMTCAKTTFFQINTLPDAYGALIEQPLHLTVKPYKWWTQTIADLGYEITWSDYDIVASQFLVVNRRHNQGE
jgi:2-polyprenyl-3-methyl-5-hydroxy-6-metoxy-1,4-benzoquinol methylase